MPYPVPVVEIAFTDGPYVVSPTWTDVTAYARGMDITRGVPDDWTLQADGSATVVLSNRDRRFDPFNTSGPYYGNLLPRRQIRIRATHGGTTYDVFRGFIAGWPPEWTDAGTDSTVTLFCFDALQLLGSSSLPADWSRDYILSQSPRHYYPCDERLVFPATQSKRLCQAQPLPSSARLLLTLILVFLYGLLWTRLLLRRAAPLARTAGPSAGIRTQGNTLSLSKTKLRA